MRERESIPEVVREVRDRLHILYGESLQQLVLYGSHARGEAQPGSDVDLLVVLDDFQDAEDELRRMAPIGSDLSLKYDVVVAFLVIREREYRERNTPLMLNIRREAVAV